MHSPKVLIITASRVIAAAYSEHLGEAGFSVEVAESGELGLAAIVRQPPEAIVLDLVLPEVETVDMMRAIRALPRLENVPVCSVPTRHSGLAEAARAAGITSVLERMVNPIRAVEQALRGALQMPLSLRAAPLFYEPPHGTAVLLNDVRASLHDLARDSRDARAWRQLFLHAHHVAGALALGGPAAASQIACALEALTADIAAMPDQANASVLCTISQAADFLGILLQRSEVPSPAVAEPGRVLIVDDEQSALQLVGAAVRFVELVPVEALSPSAALATAQGAHFDLIFLDVGLPEMNGFDLCSQLRATSGHDRTPIVFLTGMATFNNRARSSLSGGNDFIGKPFHLLELGLKALIWVQRGRLAAA